MINSLFPEIASKMTPSERGFILREFALCIRTSSWGPARGLWGSAGPSGRADRSAFAERSAPHFGQPSPQKNKKIGIDVVLWQPVEALSAHL